MFLLSDSSSIWLKVHIEKSPGILDINRIYLQWYLIAMKYFSFIKIELLEVAYYN